MKKSTTLKYESLLLKQVCNYLLLPISEYQINQLLEYLILIKNWNRIFKLLSSRDKTNILIRHFFDSLTVVNSIVNVFRNQKRNEVDICDVGSGNGFPGVILAIMQPDIQIICIDSKEKKTAFLNYVKNSLHLGNLSVKHGRIENFNCLNCKIAIARAFASLSKFANLAGKHIQTGGFLVSMKGKRPNIEIDNLVSQGCWKVKFIESLNVPRLNESRCLIWMQAI